MFRYMGRRHERYVERAPKAGAGDTATDTANFRLLDYEALNVEKGVRS